MTVANTDKPGEVSIPLGSILYGRGYMLFYLPWYFAVHLGDEALGHNTGMLSHFVVVFVPMASLLALLGFLVARWFSRQLILSADGLEVRRRGRVSFSIPWGAIGIIRGMQLYLWSGSSQIEIIGTSGELLGKFPRPDQNSGYSAFYYVASALMSPASRIVRAMPRAWSLWTPRVGAQFDEPRLRDMGVKTALLLHQMGVSQAKATYSVKRQWGVQPKPDADISRVIGILLLVVFVGGCVGLMALLPGRQNLKTSPLTAPLGIAESLAGIGLLWVGARNLLAYRAAESDVQRGIVDQILVDGDSAWLIEHGQRIPVTMVENLKCYGRERERYRMGVQTVDGPLFFDPTRLTIDATTTPGVMLDPSAPLPIPPVLAPST